jgi:hypothetical protein
LVTAGNLAWLAIVIYGNFKLVLWVLGGYSSLVGEVRCGKTGRKREPRLSPKRLSGGFQLGGFEDLDSLPLGKLAGFFSQRGDGDKESLIDFIALSRQNRG